MPKQKKCRYKPCCNLAARVYCCPSHRRLDYSFTYLPNEKAKKAGKAHTKKASR